MWVRITFFNKKKVFFLKIFIFSTNIWVSGSLFYILPSGPKRLKLELTFFNVVLLLFLNLTNLKWWTGILKHIAFTCNKKIFFSCYFRISLCIRLCIYIAIKCSLCSNFSKWFYLIVQHIPFERSQSRIKCCQSPQHHNFVT